MRAITLTEIAEAVEAKQSKSRLWDDERTYTMHEATFVLNELGFEIVRRQNDPTWSAWGTGIQPVHVLAKLVTACGAERFLPVNWPPPQTYRIPMYPRLSAMFTEQFHPFDHQIECTVRDFDLERVESEGGQPLAIYRERL